MAKKAYRVRNWRQYNESLVNRGSLTFWFREEIFQEWHSKRIKGIRGRPEVYPEAIILAILTIRQVYKLTLRHTEGFITSIIKMCGLGFKAPDYTTLSLRGKRLNVPLLPRKQNTPLHVLVDSTGVQVVGEGEWKTLIHGKTKCQLWRKLHITLNADNHDILSGTMTESVRLDGNYLTPLINKIEGQIAQITGDGAYDKKECYRIAHRRGAKAVFPPQRDAAIQRNKYNKDPALEQRDKTILYIGKDGDRDARLKQWKQENNYHKRSLIETTMSRLKFIFGDRMRSRSYENQENELRIRCYILNQMNTLGLPQSEAIA